MNPLAQLYGVATSVRNSLFDHEVLKPKRLRLPVISVGNLSVGGTGKTPFVIALGELLKSRKINFDILSRGYGRKTRGVLVVDSDGIPSQCGDEPLLLARQLGVPVVVGESRFAAGQVAEQKFESQLHILDDGFQHRSLARDFDIVLLAESDLADDLLPSGRMREPLSSLQRADAVILPDSQAQYSQKIPELARLEQRKLLFYMRRTITVPAGVEKPIVFCGIARPQQFFDQVRTAGITPAAEVQFPDHHPYTTKDVEHLHTRQRQTGAESFLTTAKDAINLQSWRDSLAPLAIASLTLTLDRPDDLVDAIQARIARQMRRS